MLRVLDELAGRLRAMACRGGGWPVPPRARGRGRGRASWPGTGQLPAVRVAGTDLTRPATESGQRPRPVLVVRVDATLIEAASPKAQAAGTYKGGFGLHPLTGWCTNVGDRFAVMLRPAMPARSPRRSPRGLDGRVRPDPRHVARRCAGQHRRRGRLPRHHRPPDRVDTAPAHGNRGRRVEYTIGWPVDQRTLAGISELREGDWGEAVDTDGVLDPDAQAADLTGVCGAARARPARHLADRPAGDRPPRPATATKPAKLGEHPDWEYGAFVTNAHGGQVQLLDARHRTQAHVEDRVKQFKACGARNLPSIDYDRNAAWLQLAALATSLTRLAAAPHPRRRARQGRHQGAAGPGPGRPGPPGHPRQTRVLKSRPAGNGRVTWPPPGTACKPCTPPDPTDHRPDHPHHPADRGTRRPPEHTRAPRPCPPPPYTTQ